MKNMTAIFFSSTVKIAICLVVLSMAANGQSSGGLEQIQKEIFTPSCGIPACHDGSFEPDFRTSQSSYYTLVYHPVTKNNSSNGFKYRVVPRKPSESVLFERITNCCFVNDNDRMPFTIGDTLSGKQIELVREWIKSGAPNINGDTIPVPANMIKFQSKFYVIANDSFPYHDDQYRMENKYTKPIVFGDNVNNIKLLFHVNGDFSEGSIVKINLFSDIIFKSLLLSKPLTKEDKAFTISLQKSEIPCSKEVYIQIETIVGNQSFVYPNKDTPNYQKRHWSFLCKH